MAGVGCPNGHFLVSYHSVSDLDHLEILEIFKCSGVPDISLCTSFNYLYDMFSKEVFNTKYSYATLNQ